MCFCFAGKLEPKKRVLDLLDALRTTFGGAAGSAPAQTIAVDAEVAAAVTRSLNDWPSTSEIRVTSFRFGRNRRRDLLLAWLNVLPVIGPLPLSSQTRDMVVILVSYK